MAKKEVKSQPKKYIVYSPIKDYCGVGAAGVHFANGQAIVHEGWVLNWFKEKGYKVVEVKEEAEAKEEVKEA